MATVRSAATPCPGADLLKQADVEKLSRLAWTDDEEEPEDAVSARSAASLDTADGLVFAGHQALPDSPEVRQLLQRAANIRRRARQLVAHISSLWPAPLPLAGSLLGALNLSSVPAADCQYDRRPNCRRSLRYRTLDGTCNNPLNPVWGAANTPYTRLLPPVYSDGVHAPRQSARGGPLPTARLLSAQLFRERPGPASRDEVLTLAHMQWGQLLAHDTAFSAIPTADEQGRPISCCSETGQLLEEPPDTCIAIQIPRDDAFYSQFGRRCMTLVRTLTAAACTLAPSDQMNRMSSFLDLSMMYGADEAASQRQRLRQRRGGLLTSQRDGRGREFPPQSARPDQECFLQAQNDTCYTSSDLRLNQNVQLVSLHTVLIREHNRLARGLAELNPRWDDERLFQEARRILIAQYQHISYAHYLPPILGERAMRQLGLRPQRQGYTYDYDVSLHPATINGFNAAAFRAFHSMIEGNLTLVDGARCPVRHYRYSDGYFRPAAVQREDNLDLLLNGMAHQPAQKLDDSFTTEVTQQLFRAEDAAFGMDGESLDITRGRDHGLPPYPAFRELCGLPPANTWRDLANTLGHNSARRLSQLYDSPQDVDVFVGGLLEPPVTGSLLGPTFRCLVAEQFHRWKRGDRFYYEMGQMPHSFSPAQLKQIRKASLSRMLCDNGDNITMVQPDPFRLVSDKNPLKPCDSPAIPKLDLGPWKQ
ncbi:peroxidase-like [Schistocerca nitens]|uniref:peroxidase-like n=1 Tax=Schistocerca nitens TaxID=7011 RepID=UPI002118688E|nr:peroxidase-like [Schistocerca nitens]